MTENTLEPRRTRPDFAGHGSIFHEPSWLSSEARQEYFTSSTKANPRPLCDPSFRARLAFVGWNRHICELNHAEPQLKIYEFGPNFSSSGVLTDCERAAMYMRILGTHSNLKGIPRSYPQKTARNVVTINYYPEALHFNGMEARVLSSPPKHKSPYELGYGLVIHPRPNPSQALPGSLSYGPLRWTRHPAFSPQKGGGAYSKDQWMS